MRIESVDFPEPLLEAQQGGSLAIFAGAGISVAAPSNLPDLRAIVERLARESGVGPEGEEPVDRYFGRLADQGHPVHRRVAEMMDDPSSRPTSLHFDLLRLFRSAEHVKLVTTNFDRHFTTAARELYGNDLEVFYAPALPLGHQLSGMVYLHGSVEKNPDRIVLTDNDFGRAYLTEGWARRFLQTLLANQTVLFVGYSHNDPVMNYLARGLPPEMRDLARHRAARRFSLTPEGQPGHWEFVGITPIPYPLSKGGNSHESLGEAIAGWVELSSMGQLDHEARVAVILKRGTPPDAEDSDYLKRVLNDAATAAHFFKHARGLPWLRWAEEQGVLEPLSRPEEAGPVAAMAADWLAEAYLLDHSPELLSLVHRLAGRMSPFLWSAILGRLTSPDHQSVAGPELSWWVSLLLESSPSVDEESQLAQLLLSLRVPEEEESALLLFAHLSRPRLLYGEEHAERQPDPEMPTLTLVAPVESLDRAWDRQFRPRLADYADRLSPILEGHLALARLLIGAARVGSQPSPIRSAGSDGRDGEIDAEALALLSRACQEARSATGGGDQSR